jgi:hypothetical protein
MVCMLMVTNMKTLFSTGMPLFNISSNMNNAFTSGMMMGRSSPPPLAFLYPGQLADSDLSLSHMMLC